MMRISTPAVRMFLLTILVLGLSVAPVLIEDLSAQTDTSPTTTTYYEGSDASQIDTSPTTATYYEEDYDASQTDTSPTTTTYYEEDDGIEEVPPAACAGCLAVGAAVPLVFLVLSIGIALWIFRDAKERGIQSPPLWAVLGFFFNVLGLVIYLIARKNMSQGPPAASGMGSAPPPPPPPVG
ncbi:MAG: PLDc N-terminal domain-containing protein [Thermoanaerobaculia bacterium]